MSIGLCIDPDSLRSVSVSHSDLAKEKEGGIEEKNLVERHNRQEKRKSVVPY